MDRRESDIVSATEIASWTWCPESWRLKALGYVPENQDALDRGETFHTQQAAVELRTRTLIAVGRRLVVMGLLLALVGLVVGWVR